MGSIGWPTTLISAAQRLPGELPAPRPRWNCRSAIASTVVAATATTAGVRWCTLTTIVPSSMVDVDAANVPSSVNASNM